MTKLFVCKCDYFCWWQPGNKKKPNVSALVKIRADWVLQDWQTVASRALLVTPHCAVHIKKHPIMQCTSWHTSLFSAHHEIPHYRVHIRKHPIMQCTSRNTQLCSTHHEISHYALHSTKHAIMQCTSRTSNKAVHITKHPITQCTLWNTSLFSFSDMVDSCKYRVGHKDLPLFKEV